MFSTLRKLFCCKEPKTPLGFCDGPSSKRETLVSSKCRKEDARKRKCRTVIYHQQYEGENEFHGAVCSGHLKVALRLLAKEGFHVNDEDARKRTAIHFACFHGHLDMVYFLLFKKCEINVLDDENSTPLMKAVQSLETEIVSVLLDNGADPNVKNSNGETAIHLAVYGDSVEIARSLIEFGANIEETIEDGLTPLMLALQKRKLLIAEYLITKGANIHARDDHQRTTLMYGVKWDCPGIVELLLKSGVNHTLRDEFKWSALQYALVGKRKVRRLILKHVYTLFSRRHSSIIGNQLKDIFSTGHHLNSESLLSVCSRTEDRVNFEPEDRVNFETQQDNPESILQNGTDDSQTMASKQYENTEAQEVWVEKCLHPELRDYSHQISEHETEPQQSQAVWAYKCLHPELQDSVHQISIPKTEPQQLEGDTNSSEEIDEEIQEYKVEKEECLDRIEESPEFQDIPENILQNGTDDSQTMASKQYENTEAQEVWVEKCLHPELRDYSHQISKHETEPQQSQAVWAYKCLHPELQDSVHQISIPKTEPQQLEGDTNSSEEIDEEIQEYKVEKEECLDRIEESPEFDAPTDTPQSSNMEIDEEKSVLRHLEKKSVMEDQKQTSEEEQTQDSGRKNKRTFIDAIRACFCSCFTKKSSSSPHHEK